MWSCQSLLLRASRQYAVTPVCNRWLHLTVAVNKGHSHFANVKDNKLRVDMAKAKSISAMCRKISLAIRNGSGQTDPVLNRELGKVLEQARYANVPKDTIKRQLERAKSRPYTVHHFDAIGPSGSFFIFEAYTDNVNKTKTSVLKYFKQVGNFRFADSKAVRSSFEEKGVLLVCDRPPAEGEEESSESLCSIEDAETLAIEVGAEEVTETTDDNGQPALQFICALEDLKSVQKGLEDRELFVTSAEVEFRSLNKITIDENMSGLIEKFLQLIDEDQEISKVYDNVRLAHETD